MAFDKDKVVEFLVGVTGIYGLYSLAGLLQEAMYLFLTQHEDDLRT